jgi:hypothetical protein
MARISPLSRLQFVPANCEISEADQRRNASSHRIGVIDDCYRCLNCEIGSWNAWKMECPA